MGNYFSERKKYMGNLLIFDYINSFDNKKEFLNEYKKTIQKNIISKMYIETYNYKFLLINFIDLDKQFLLIINTNIRTKIIKDTLSLLNFLLIPIVSRKNEIDLFDQDEVSVDVERSQTINESFVEEFEESEEETDFLDDLDIFFKRDTKVDKETKISNIIETIKEDIVEDEEEKEPEEYYNKFIIKYPIYSLLELSNKNYKLVCKDIRNDLFYNFINYNESILLLDDITKKHYDNKNNIFSEIYKILNIKNNFRSHIKVLLRIIKEDLDKINNSNEKLEILNQINIYSEKNKLKIKEDNKITFFKSKIITKEN